MSFFKDKIVIVTGGTNGIGKALVELLLQQGAKVVTCGRNFDKLYEMQLQYSDLPFVIHKADIQHKEDCRRLIELTIKNFGSIDILINNAGISMRALFEDVSLETLEQLMNTNFWGAVYCTKYALPYLVKSKGIVAAVSSIAGFRGLPGRSGYSASKFALNGWLESIRVELKDKVNVLWVCPGFTASNIRNAALNDKATPDAKSLMNEEKMMSAEDCAAQILKSITKKKRTLILTAQGKEAVFMNRFFPSWTDKLIRKFYFKEGKLIK